jgi:hypothetical protein
MELTSIMNDPWALAYTALASFVTQGTGRPVSVNATRVLALMAADFKFAGYYISEICQ